VDLSAVPDLQAKDLVSTANVLRVRDRQAAIQLSKCLSSAHALFVCERRTLGQPSHYPNGYLP
jgi:hypothetical protein